MKKKKRELLTFEKDLFRRGFLYNFDNQILLRKKIEEIFLISKKEKIQICKNAEEIRN